MICCAAAPAMRISPRMLGAFNEATPDWLSFFMFTYFTDRDGKMQLHSLAQSGFDPLSRTCRFMLTEEAHHMFVGETGISRVVQRTCEAMKEAGITDPTDIAKVRALGVIDLPTIQKKLHSALFAVARSVRLGSLDQRRERLQCRHQGPLPGNPDRRRPSAQERHLSGAQAGRRRDQARRRAGADRAQHAAARRLHAGLRQGHAALEQGHLDRRLSVQADAAERRVPPPDRRVQGHPRHARGRPDRRRHLERSARANGCRRPATATSSLR